MVFWPKLKINQPRHGGPAAGEEEDEIFNRGSAVARGYGGTSFAEGF
jgi:hypothetical protein